MYEPENLSVPEWEGISQSGGYTEGDKTFIGTHVARMKVPGGYLYRTQCWWPNTFQVLAVSTAFVPLTPEAFLSQVNVAEPPTE